MVQCQFQLIIGETPVGKLLRKMSLVNYGLIGLVLVCALLPKAHFLLLASGVLYVVFIICVAALEQSKNGLYQTEGIIELDETGVRLNSLAIQAMDLRQIEVKFNIPRGQGIGRNGVGDKGNRINIYTKASTPIVMVTVLVEARAQRDNLARVLKQWRKSGIKVSADGIDLN